MGIKEAMYGYFTDQSKPIGVAFWATVNEEVEARLAAGTTKMRPQDWKSGDRLWAVEVIALFAAPRRW